MNDCERDGDFEAKELLNKIVADFEALDQTLDSAIALLKAGNKPGGDVVALERAREAARKGAQLAKNNVMID